MHMDYPFAEPVLIFWIAVVLIIFTVSLFRYLSRRSKYRLLEKLAESGQPLPPEFLRGLETNLPSLPKTADANPVSSGITLMCIGVALMLFFWAFQGFENPFGGDSGWFVAIGIFPFMIGLARLLSAVFARHETPKD